MENNWKNLILKSGLPLEYEVRECFAENECTVWEETTYLRSDENFLEKEFSYDVHANTWINGHSVDFLVECKYKTESTKWFFLPHTTSYQYDLEYHDFLHPIDHFSKHSFYLKGFPHEQVFPPLGPFCQKGVEIFRDKYFEQNITKAISQLSYVLMKRAVECWREQLSSEMFSDALFLNIPIIITNADLYLINKKTTINRIRQTKEIDEIATRCDFLLYHNKIGAHLYKHNYEIFSQFFSGFNKKLLTKRLSTFTKDFGHFANVLCSQDLPTIILIMHHSNDHQNYATLFNYLNDILNPNKEILEKLRGIMKERKKLSTELSANIKKNS